MTMNDKIHHAILIALFLVKFERTDLDSRGCIETQYGLLEKVRILVGLSAGKRGSSFPEGIDSEGEKGDICIGEFMDKKLTRRVFGVMTIIFH